MLKFRKKPFSRSFKLMENSKIWRLVGLDRRSSRVSGRAGFYIA